MAFQTQNSSSNDLPTMAEINIIPLVDVMLVLLIISMVTTPFMEQGLEVNLPNTKSSANLEKSTTEEPIFLYISASKGLMLGDRKVSKDDLAARLASLFQNREKKEIFVKADKSIPYGDVADVMTRVQAAGIAKVGLVTLPE